MSIFLHVYFIVISKAMYENASNCIVTILNNPYVILLKSYISFSELFQTILYCTVFLMF